MQIGQLAVATSMYESWNGAPPQSLESLVVKAENARIWPEGGFLAGGKGPRDP